MEIRKEKLLSLARGSQTKASWEHFFGEYRGAIETIKDSPTIAEIFRLLSSDPYSLHYDALVWQTLLQACINSWDLKLGLCIANFARKVTDLNVTILCGKIHLDSGYALTARDIALRGLRRARLSTSERRQLEMILCSSHLEEGHRKKAERLLAQMETHLSREKVLGVSETADMCAYLGRSYFLLGRYQDAREPFRSAAESYLQLRKWEEAAKCLFNVAASVDNTGASDPEERDLAFTYVERCKKLSLDHDLKGPLAHCEAFYGHGDYWRGQFSSARDHFRRALSYIPANNVGYRRLHILSMLTFTYLRTGKFIQAKRFGQETLRLAAQEESDRFFTRHENLRAELLWESGEIVQSQERLKEFIADLSTQGIHTLEELSIFSRYLYQCSLLGTEDPLLPLDIRMDPSLERNQSSWCEYQVSLAMYQLVSKDFVLAKRHLQICLERSQEHGDLYHHGLALLGQIQLDLYQNTTITAESESKLETLKVLVAKMVETPMRVHCHILDAAFSYRNGDIKSALQSLRHARRTTGIGFIEKFLIDLWLQTHDGKSPRFQHDWQRACAARYSRCFFGIRIAEIEEDLYEVTQNFRVDLRGHPSLGQLFRYLLEQKSSEVTMEQLQQDVWQQSTKQQGWEQKVRNSVMRLRQCFGECLAPVILHQGGLRLFTEAIDFVDSKTFPQANPAGIDQCSEKILKLLKAGPLSTLEITNRLNVSAATTKRLLKKLSELDQVTIIKSGRHVFYQSQLDH